MFYITDGKGFQMKFSNGWTVSVQFGTFNYCDNQRRFAYDADRQAGEDGCPNAEIAAWDINGKWYTFGSDTLTIKGWCTPDEVAEFIAKIVAMPPVEPVEE